MNEEELARAIIDIFLTELEEQLLSEELEHREEEEETPCEGK